MYTTPRLGEQEKCTPQCSYEHVYDDACPARDSESATVTSSTSPLNRPGESSNMSSSAATTVLSPLAQDIIRRITDIPRLQRALAELCGILASLAGTPHNREALSPGEHSNLQRLLMDANTAHREMMEHMSSQRATDQDTVMHILTGGEEKLLSEITSLSIAESWITIGEQRALGQHPQSLNIAICRHLRAEARFRLFKGLNTLEGSRLMSLNERRDTLFPQEPVEEDEATMVRDFFQITIDHPQGHMCPICHADLDADPDNEQEQEEEEERDEAVGHRGHRAVTTPCCNQWFHVSCLLQWRLDHATCPMCRGVLEEAFAREMIERRIAELATL